MEEEHAIEDKGLSVAPRLESLSDDIGEAVDNERRAAGDEHRMKAPHREGVNAEERAGVIRKAAASGREAIDRWAKGGGLIETDKMAAKSGRISHCATEKDRNVSVKPHGDCAALMNGSPCSTIAKVEMRVFGAEAAEPTAYRVCGSGFSKAPNLDFIRLSPYLFARKNSAKAWLLCSAACIPPRCPGPKLL